MLATFSMVMLATFSFGLYTVMTLSFLKDVHNVNIESTNVKTMPESPISTQYSSLPTCLRLGFENDMDQLLSNYKQVFVVMPAKAAGSTFKEFTKTCMKKRAFKDDNILEGEKLKNEIRGDYELPSLISSHLSTFESFVNLMNHATEQSLIIYSHRKETERLRSAIVEVAKRECNAAGTYETRKCVLEEDNVIELIAKRTAEVKCGASNILTCETYKSIEANTPNLVFVNYKQADRIQTLLAKHHNCSKMEAIRANVGSKKFPMFVKLNNTYTDTANLIVDLNDWLDGKMELMELGLQLKKNASCQAKTNKIQRALLSCPDETLLVSKSDFFD